MGRTTSESTSVKEVFSCKLCFISFWKSFYCTEIWASVICFTLVVLFMYGIGALYCALSLSFLPTCVVYDGTPVWLHYIFVGLLVSLTLFVILTFSVLYIWCFYKEFKITVGITLFLVLLFGIPLLVYESTDLCLIVNSCNESCEEATDSRSTDSSVLRLITDIESCNISRNFVGYFGFGFIFWLMVAFIGSIVFVVLSPIGYFVYYIRKWWKSNNHTFMVRVQQNTIVPSAKTQPPVPILPVSRTIPTTYTSPTVPKSSFIQTDSECSICTNVIKYKDLTTLQCGHKFHNDCINDWLQRNKNCPYCRGNTV